VPRALIEAQYEQAARFPRRCRWREAQVKVNEHTIGYMPIADKAPPNAAAQGKKPSQNEAFFLRRERAPTIPTCSPAAASTSRTSGRPTCRASASRR
jgi:hypothetical protein